MTKDYLQIPLDEQELADVLDKYATDAFEVIKFLEAYAASVGKKINHLGVFSKLLDKWDKKEEQD